jgi:hypothetical protein
MPAKTTPISEISISSETASRIRSLHRSDRDRDQSAWITADRGGRERVHEKTRAEAAPRKPKKGAVSSPLNTDDIFASPPALPPLLLLRSFTRRRGRALSLSLLLRWPRAAGMDRSVVGLGLSLSDLRRGEERRGNS